MNLTIHSLSNFLDISFTYSIICIVHHIKITAHLNFIKNYKIQPRQKTQICQHSFEGKFKSVPTIPFLLKSYGVNSINNICILGFQKHILITQIPSIEFIMKFLTDKHRICQIDRFAQFSCKITNNYQNSIFCYEISYT